VAEWLNAAVLKFARQYSHLIQINNLAAHGTTSKWGVLGGLGERLCNSGYYFFLSESTPKHSDNATIQDLEVLEV